MRTVARTVERQIETTPTLFLSCPERKALTRTMKMRYADAHRGNVGDAWYCESALSFRHPALLP